MQSSKIVRLATRELGVQSAIAKGVRRAKSRFGGRLEPFFRLDLILHEGRGDLMTVTNVSTVDGYPRLRSSGPALAAGARACDAVLRLLDSAEPNPPAYNLLRRYLSLLDDPEQTRAAELETALARYTEIFDFAPIGYTTISLDGTLHEINHTAARLFRRSRSDLLGRHLDAMPDDPGGSDD